MTWGITVNNSIDPCPCCGGTARVMVCADESSENFEGKWIECCKCGLCTQIRFPLQEDVAPQLIEMWNRRVPVPKWQPRSQEEESGELEFECDNTGEGSCGEKFKDVAKIQALEYDKYGDAICPVCKGSGTVTQLTTRQGGK